MDSLIGIGSAAALVYGVWAIYQIGFGLGHGDLHLVHEYSMDLYFESAGMILTLITVGKYLESRAKGRTSQAITKLVNLAPKTAVRLTENGAEEEIPLKTFRPGIFWPLSPANPSPPTARWRKAFLLWMNPPLPGKASRWKNNRETRSPVVPSTSLAF